MGGSNSDYRPQVTQALDQANQPKSQFAQNYSNWMNGGEYTSALSGLLNGSSLGNAFPGMYKPPGQVMNNYQPQSNATNPYPNYGGSGPIGNPNNITPIDTNQPWQGLGSGRFSLNGMNPNYNLSGGMGLGLAGGGNNNQTQGTSPYQQWSQDHPANQPTDLNGWTFKDETGKLVNPTSNDFTWTQNQYGAWMPTPKSSSSYGTPSGQSFLSAQAPAGYDETNGFFGDAGRTGFGLYPDKATGIPGYQGGNFGTQPVNRQQPTGDNYSSGVLNPSNNFPMSAYGNGNFNQQQGNYNFNPSNNTFSPQGGFNPQGGMNGLFPNIQTASPQFGQLNFQGPNNNALNTLMSQIGMPGMNNYNPNQSLMSDPRFNQTYNPMQGLGIGGLSSALQSQIAGLQTAGVGAANLGGLNTGNVDINNSNINPSDSQYYQGVQQSLQHQFDINNKNLLAQFGGSGTERGTPAAFALAEQQSSQIPQLAQSLGAVRQQEFGNQLAQRELAQQGNLQEQGQNLGAVLQNQGLQNNFLQGNVSALGNLNNATQGLQLQNYFNSIGANQASNSLLSSLAQNAGGLGLGQNQLNSQNYFNSAGMNSQNANLALQNQLGFQTNQNQSMQGQNSMLSNLAQFNSGQQNDTTQRYMQMLQAANQQQIQNQFTGYQNFAQLAAQLAGLGYPGGSANVNLGQQSQTWLQQLGGLF